LFVATVLLGPTAPLRAEDNEPFAVIELGAATERSVQDGTYSAGPSDVAYAKPDRRPRPEAAIVQLLANEREKPHCERLRPCQARLFRSAFLNGGCRLADDVDHDVGLGEHRHVATFDLRDRGTHAL
jgi:hypothetical protein